MKELIKALQEKDRPRALALAKQLRESKQGESVQGLSLQAAALNLAGNHIEALTLIKQGLQIEPQNKALRFNKANLLQAMGDTNAAEEELKELVSSEPSFQPAKKKLEQLQLSQRGRSLPSSEMRAESLARVKNPLIAAFEASEVEVDRKTREENEKRKRSRKLQQKPELPPIAAGVMAEEWLLAASDALRCGVPEMALELINYARSTGATSGISFSLAGDAYMKLKNNHMAHLCYLLARETIELGPEQQLNLVALSLEIGDHELSRLRIERLGELPNESLLKRRLDKLMIHYPPEFNKVYLKKEQINRHKRKGQ